MQGLFGIQISRHKYLSQYHKLLLKLLVRSLRARYLSYCYTSNHVADCISS